MIVKKTIISEVVRKTTEPMNSPEYGTVNQKEARIITELGTKILEAMSFHAENPKVMTSFFGVGTNEIGTPKEKTNGSGEKMSTSEDALVMSPKRISKGLEAGTFRDDRLKGEMSGTGKPRAGKESSGTDSLLEETNGGRISHGKNFLRSAMDVKDHVIEVAVILPKGLTITDVAHPPRLTDRRGDHHLHMALHGVHTASWNADEAYPQGVVEMKVIARVPLEKVVMAWDENLYQGGVGIQHPSMSVDAH